VVISRNILINVVICLINATDVIVAMDVEVNAWYTFQRMLRDPITICLCVHASPLQLS
jgi:hypothetical protein